MARKTQRPRRFGILPTLAVLFLSAAGLRLAVGLDAALARDPEQGIPNVAQSEAPQVPLPAAPAQTAEHQDPAHILLDLRRRETELASRTTEIEGRLAILEATELRVRDQIDALRTAEAELEATMALADRAAEDDIARLVGVFEAMEAEQAAAVFAEMETSFAAGFLGRLTPQTAAEILAGLDPRQAYALSALIAGRNALVPRE